MEEKRITEFGIQDIKLLNGKILKVRPFTFKEKRDYIALLDSLKEKEQSDDITKGYISMQVEVAFFIAKVLNPEVTKEEIESQLTGEEFKKMLDVAFYDPFANLSMGR